ncbi:myosin-9-like isoform X2 [Phoenix dactylifera]|uniref:Myosin-9-like isoform X2 n=1 Tax=Phoenix dactylifera TaxID=42345 RepID=A0A8B7BIH7_PHODC|nr:myosin-9-like isoform X2 [Phoenix dactylifera]
MEGEMHESSAEVKLKLPHKVNVKVVEGERESLINGDPLQQIRRENKEEEEETASDGEFIKVEKELIDVKESSHLLKPIAEVEETLRGANLDLQAMEEKIRALELQLETVTKELQRSESEKSLLKSEVDLTNGKLEKMDQHCEELELDRKRMKEQILEAEQKHNLQLESLQEALRLLDMKQKELDDVKEAFDGLSAELESSRKKMEELEAELVLSAGEVHKFEELSNERSTHAELESKRALEFEKMLELAKLNAKEMEDQMGNLQEELKGLRYKIAENQQVEEALTSTALELSVVQESLELSKSQVTDLEQKFVSRDAVIHELTQEINLHKASEHQMRENVLELESLLSATKEDLQAKLVDLEEVEFKLRGQMKEKEMVESSLKDQNMQILALQEELVMLTGQRDTLQIAVADLNTKLSMTEETCGQLEAKLNLADQNFTRTDSLLSQALSCKGELEQMLKSLKGLHQESSIAAETATRRSCELEDLIQASNATEEGLKAQLRETEMRLASTEKRKIELEQHLNLAEVKNIDAEREIKELSEKMIELVTLLKKSEEESALSRCHFQAYEDRISQMESSLSNSSSRNSHLEQELKDLAKKCAEHEDKATAAYQRNLELEDLVDVSHSKAEDGAKKVGELELLLEAANYRTQELEQLLSTTEAKRRDAEVESKQYSSKVSEISAELEAFQTKSASLEALLQAANEKERELTEMLNIVTAERMNLEDLANISGKKLLEAENLIVVLQSELKYIEENLKSVEKELEASGVREKDILEKLRSAEEKLEHRHKEVEQTIARNLELESLHESLVKDSDLKLQEAAVSFMQKESEAKQLNEKLKSHEEQVAFYQAQATEAAENVASLEAELETNAIKLVTLEITIQELKQKASEADLKAEQSISDNELLSGMNSKLREDLEAHQCKVNELHELLNLRHAEKEATAEQLASHVKTIAKLTDEHSRGLEFQSATESRIKETEVQLHDAIEKFTHRDSEARNLNEKLLALEAQLKTFEEQARETAVVAENQKVELEETLLKLQNVEGLAEEMQRKVDHFRSENEGLESTNLSLSQKLATYETKMNELQTALNIAIAEKVDTSLQLHSSRKTLEDLMQQFDSEKEKLQSQITSVMEENNMLNEMYQNAKKELEAIIVQLEEQLNAQKDREVSLNADVENLKAELAEKFLIQSKISQLEQQLLLAENKYMEKIESMRLAAAEKEAVLTSKLNKHESTLHERDALYEQLNAIQKELDLACKTKTEQKELDSMKELEREALMKKSLDEMEAKNQHATLLEKQVEELKQKLQIAETQYKEKVIEEGKKLALVNAELDDLKHKLSQTVEMEKKIAELGNKLATAKSREEVKDGIVEAKPKDGVEVISRDIGLSTSTPSKRSKRRSKEVHQTAQTTSTISTMNAAPESSGLMAFKSILGVALVSIIIGIILGKRF